MTSSRRLSILFWLTVLVPAVCAGLFETVRHTLLVAELPLGLGTWLAAALVLAISFGFARAAFGIIRRVEASLLERNRTLEALSKKVERLAVIEERDRLAREMHDGIAQVLAYTLVSLDTVDSLLARGRTAEAAKEVERLRASGQEAYNEVREAIAGLRTRPEAGAAGLADALREYVSQFGERTGVCAAFSAGALEPDDLPAAAELQLMRIAQEALTNVRKHARAASVSVHLARSAGGWTLTVSDDGEGFDRDGAPGAADDHYGLTMMRERAESAGGSLRVTSKPGAGTTVQVAVPPAGDARIRNGDGDPTPSASRRVQPAPLAAGRAARLAG